MANAVYTHMPTKGPGFTMHQKIQAMTKTKYFQCFSLSVCSFVWTKSIIRN